MREREGVNGVWRALGFAIPAPLPSSLFSLSPFRATHVCRRLLPGQADTVKHEGDGVDVDCAWRGEERRRVRRRVREDKRGHRCGLRDLSHPRPIWKGKKHPALFLSSHLPAAPRTLSSAS
jgi:hypothetical protein